jgi:hypothetical protein
MAKLQKPEQPIKPFNMRSEKPAIERVNRNVNKNLTLEEMDFHKYVLGGEEDIDNATIKSTKHS